jgi:hypothetical protein
MAARCVVDTNLLVYAMDRKESITPDINTPTLTEVAARRAMHDRIRHLLADGLKLWDHDRVGGWAEPRANQSACGAAPRQCGSFQKARPQGTRGR